MTASAVGNMPEKEVDTIKEMVMRGVMHADENFFDFKVSHHEWIYGPNCGLVDIALSKTGRPDITLTLIAHDDKPKLRNLELGNSKIDVKNPNQSAASKSAYATAEIVGVPPGQEGGGKKSGGCKCQCSIS
eukprot:jgi/Undpi1/12622/HiC_scaffold_6.g02290.m1